MRVIGGQFRSRVLVAPPGNDTRPTSDRLRETLFNVLSQRLAGQRVADLYAGSGAVGIEALSRGAASCFFVERAAPALTALRKNLNTLDLLQQTRIEAQAVSRALGTAVRDRRQFDLVFLDPPYEAAAEYLATLGFLGQHSAALLTAEALVVAEHARRSSLGESYGKLTRWRVLEQGDAALSFYAQRIGEEPDAL